MKKVFKKSYLLENSGCYNIKKMSKLTSPRKNDDDDIFIHEILDSEVPLSDKYYFVFKHCDVKIDDMLEQMMFLLEITKIHYKSLEVNNEVVNIMENILLSYFKSDLSNKELISYKQTLEDIGINSVNDTKFVTLGLYHLIDMIDAIANNEPFSDILSEADYTIKRFIKSLVSRPDLKEKLLNMLKDYTK